MSSSWYRGEAVDVIILVSDGEGKARDLIMLVWSGGCLYHYNRMRWRNGRLGISACWYGGEVNGMRWRREEC